VEERETPRRGRVLTLTVAPEDDGRSVRTVLRQRLEVSGTLLGRMRREPERLLCNGSPIRTVDPVHAGDRLEITVSDPLPPPRETVCTAPPPVILYEDEDLLILDKPAGLAVHGANELGYGTVRELLARYCGLEVFHPINRLDRGTSGIMAVAKHSYMTDRLRQQLHTDGFRREYLAVTQGCPTPRQGRILLPIGRPGEGHFRTVMREGQEAETHFRVLWTDGVRSLVRARPCTGRTHQIRVHLSALGAPLCGDWLYGPYSASVRPALHSAELWMHHPLTGETLHLQAPLPDDLRAMLPPEALALADAPLDEGGVPFPAVDDHPYLHRETPPTSYESERNDDESL
jgi:23S rRNA pseudouridine1911/1915/1917 synthase